MESKKAIIDVKPQAFTIDIVFGGELTTEDIDAGTDFYTQYRNRDDEAVKIGLYGDDLRDSLGYSETVVLKYSDNSESEGVVHAPLLIPVEKLEWFNAKLMRETLGDKRMFYYAHPPIPDDPKIIENIAAEIQARVTDASLVFFDNYQDREIPKAIQAILSNQKNTLVNMGRGEEQRIAKVFADTVIFKGVEQVVNAPSLIEVYNSAVKNGLLEIDQENGVSLVDSVEGEEANELWKIYDEPFSDLGEDHPTYAGFDEELFKDILKDTEIEKIVVKDNGRVVALCMFLNNFKKCPWFNEKYYADNFPEYHETNNILLFPGIVAAKDARGNSYGMQMISFAAQLYQLRGSNMLITFECTEISSKYIPKIVSYSLNHTGISSISNKVLTPISATDYLAIVNKDSN